MLVLFILCLIVERTWCADTGNIEVLGVDLIVVEDPPGAEAHHVAAEIPDRPEQAAMEAVDRPATAILGQRRLVQLVEGEAGLEQVLGQPVPTRRGEAAAEPGGCLGVEASDAEKLARLGRLDRGQLLDVELGRPAIGLQQPGPSAPVALDAGPAATVGEPEADPVGQPLDGLDEADVLDLHHEVDHAAALAAAEAVEGAVGRADVERRRLLVVERAQAAHRTRARPAQRDVLADDLLDPVAVADLGDVAVPDPPRHGRESRRGQPTGPCPRARYPDPVRGSASRR